MKKANFYSVIFFLLVSTILINACVPSSTLPSIKPIYDFKEQINTIKLMGPDSGCIKTYPQVSFETTTTNGPTWDNSINPTLISFVIYPQIPVVYADRNFSVTFGTFPEFFYISETIKTADNTFITKELSDTTLYQEIIGKALYTTNGAYGYAATWKVELNEKGSHIEPVSCLAIYENGVQ